MARDRRLLLGVGRAPSERTVRRVREHPVEAPAAESSRLTRHGEIELEHLTALGEIVLDEVSTRKLGEPRLELDGREARATDALEQREADDAAARAEVADVDGPARRDDELAGDEVREQQRVMGEAVAASGLEEAELAPPDPVARERAERGIVELRLGARAQTSSSGMIGLTTNPEANFG